MRGPLLPPAPGAPAFRWGAGYTQPGQRSRKARFSVPPLPPHENPVDRGSKPKDACRVGGAAFRVGCDVRAPWLYKSSGDQPPQPPKKRRAGIARTPHPGDESGHQSGHSPGNVLTVMALRRPATCTACRHLRGAPARFRSRPKRADGAGARVVEEHASESGSRV